MYQSYFGLTKKPFGIVPDIQFLYLSQSHQEAIAHLAYAINDKNGFVQLTGEVGLGKTLVCRYLLSKLPENMDVALVLNPKLTGAELLQTICNELNIPYSKNDSARELTEKISQQLLEAHAKDRHNLLIIEEAQNLPKATLEQVRLLTNLETDDQKLLRIILIGQPELANFLGHYDMRQVAQRITSRYHFNALSRTETKGYIKHRLAVAGCTNPLFTASALARIHKITQGTPRLINLVCDRSLIGAYSLGVAQVNTAIVKKAAKEALPQSSKPSRGSAKPIIGLSLLLVLLGAFFLQDHWRPYLSEKLSIFSHIQTSTPITSPKDAPIAVPTKPEIYPVDPSIKTTIERQTDSDFRLGIPGKEPEN